MVVLISDVLPIEYTYVGNKHLYKYIIFWSVVENVADNMFY